MPKRSYRFPGTRVVSLLWAVLLLSGVVAEEALAQSLAKAAQGQKIFFKVCVQCHTLKAKNQPSGPGLQGVMQRVPSEDWLLDWLENPEAMIESGNAYAQSISDDYPLDMPKLPVMQRESNRKAIVTFLKQMEKVD